MIGLHMLIVVIAELVLHMIYYYLQQVYVKMIRELQKFLMLVKNESIELLHLVEIQILQLMCCLLVKVLMDIIHLLLIQFVLVLWVLVFVVLKIILKVIEV